MKYYGRAAGLCVLVVLLSGCGSTPNSQSDTVSEVTTENVLQATQKTHRLWREKLIHAEALRIYSPDKFILMMESWLRADSLYKEIQASPETVNQSYSLFTSGTYLDRFHAEMVIVENNYKELEYLKRVADEALAPAITQMEYLQSINANDHYRSEFVRLTRFYTKLFGLVAQGDVSDAKEEQEEFLSRAHSLEVRVIKRIYITPQEEALSQLRRNDVRYYAPLSYAKVEAEISAAKDLIDKSPRAFESINKFVAVIKFELAHAEHIAKGVQYLRDRSRDEYEAYLLALEAKMLNISLALNDSDLRNIPLEDQALQIRTDAVKIRQDYDIATALRKTDTSAKQLEALHALIRQQNDRIALLQSQLSSVVTATNTEKNKQLPAESLTHQDVDSKAVSVKVSEHKDDGQTTP
ncbi:hypothetical protein [Photobacterium nomapromontoriensis]|uniref:hypothetical protein n=1 Tax=Photobacterium nomapromontoriensis TaxID=2910237 RepID=UPI003D0C5E50